MYEMLARLFGNRVELGICLKSFSHCVPQLAFDLMIRLNPLGTKMEKALVPGDIASRPPPEQQRIVDTVMQMHPDRRYWVMDMQEKMRSDGQVTEVMAMADDLVMGGANATAIGAVVLDASGSSGAARSDWLELIKDAAAGKVARLACMKVLNKVDCVLADAFTADKNAADAAAGVRLSHAVEMAATLIDQCDPDGVLDQVARDALMAQLHLLGPDEQDEYMESVKRMSLLGIPDVPGAHMVRLMTKLDCTQREELLQVFTQGMNYVAFLQVAAWMVPGQQ